MSPPRILHLFNAFRIGGVERQHLRLVEVLRDHFTQVCWAINTGPAQAELDVLGIQHHWGPFDTVPHLVETGNFDCIVIRTNRVLYTLADYFRESSIPIVYTRGYLRWADNLQYYDPHWEKVGVDMADYVLFSGPMLRNPVVQLLGEENIPGGETIFNGLDLLRYPLTMRSAPNPRRPFRVGILGNLCPRKNQITAIRVLRDRLSSGDMRLSLGGDIFENEDYARQLRVEAEGLEVVFEGYVPNPIDFLAGVDALLLCSTLEGWPNVIMEAFACGLPVVSTGVGDVPGVFGSTMPGIIYSPGEHGRILECLDYIREPVAYERLSKLAVDRARELDVSRSAEVLRRAICSVIRQS